jgi:hypothetical protein
MKSDPFQLPVWHQGPGLYAISFSHHKADLATRERLKVAGESKAAF